jgi:hypothetical protein
MVANFQPSTCNFQQGIMTTTKPPTFQGFSFTREDVPPAPGILGDYRARAWTAFERLPYPTAKDEPWRRTSLRGLEAAFTLPREGACRKLPPLPKHLLTPLVSDQHGGQITLLPGGVNIEPGDEITPGYAVIQATSAETGDNEAQIDASVDGEPIEIAFNVKYMTDVLNVIDTPQVALETSNPMEPGVIKPVGDNGFVHIIMPMHFGR